MRKKQKYIDHNAGEKIRLVAKEIILMEISPTDTLISLQKKFYRIMAKHKIKMQHSEDGGKTFTGNCFEYTICKTMFMDRMRSAFELAEWGYGIFKNLPIPKTVER